MPDPLDLARAAWPGEWSYTQKDVYVMMLPTPPSSLDWSEIRSTVRVFPADNWWFVSVDVGDMELFDDEGPDLTDLLTRARAASVDALVPLLRAIGADLITAALAATE